MGMNRDTWLKRYGYNPQIREITIGARVRGSPGRVSENWTGVIVGNSPFQDGRDYWQVRWYERDYSSDKHQSKQPVIGNTTEQLQLY
jgi:hypothetical protein